MLDKIQQIKAEMEQLHAQTLEDAEALRIKYLSKKGLIPQLMEDFRSVPAEMKKEVGIKINELKTLAQERINALKESLATQETASASSDLTRTP